MWFRLNCWLVKLAVSVVRCVCSPAFPVLPWQQVSLLQVPGALWRWLASCGNLEPTSSVPQFAGTLRTVRLLYTHLNHLL